MNPLLRTKLYVPVPGDTVVPRPRLLGQLQAGLHGKLTLISAPAGFGKSTLVSDWIVTGERPTAWLSLDEGENDLARFLAYLVAALQTIAPTVGAESLGLLQSAQPPPIEVLLTVLLNDITTLPNKVVLVLDDYHVIEATPVDQALAFLLEHLPPQLHLVITTRADPPLPLARLRARGQLTEVRAADLRFTPTEAAAFLNQMMRLDLSAEEVAVLESHTEGWIAGLQLAALSLRGSADVAQFIRTFAGDNRYIVDYLVEEVLQRQPARVRSFLLQTALLDRLCGPLCDAVTGQAEGSAQLAALERGNFFVVPLDDQRHWYRYHHLFADVLATHLRAEQPDQVATLHQRASLWYEQDGSVADAIRHALAAQDFARAAGLIERAVPDTRRSRQEATLLGWLKALPDEVVQVRPVLNVHYAGTLLQSGELQGVEKRLQDAERWLDTTANMRPVVVDEEEFRRLPGWLAIYRAGQALVRGDVSATVTYAQRALDLVPEDEQLGRGAAAALLGLAFWTSGDLEAAYRSYAEGMAHLQQAGNIADVVGGALALADIRLAQGRLREAMRTYEQALQLATAQHPAGTRPVLRGTADMYVGLSEIHREQDDLPAATQHLLRSKALGEHTGFPQNPYRWRVAMARICEAQGDLEGALALLHEAERLYVSDFYPNVRPVAALKARVWVAQGRMGEALDWARAQGLSAYDGLSYLREFEHMTLARVLLACSLHDRADHSLQEALGLLERLLQAAEAGERTGRALEILVLQALAHQVQGDLPAALASLNRALMLAEPEGYVRLFVDEGEAMRLMLVAFSGWLVQQPASAQTIKLTAYTDKLVARFGHEPSRVDHPLLAEQSKIPNPKSQIPNLVEPLSERELEVLRLLGTDLSGPEMARHLMVSLNTLHTHTKNIYSKLGVNNRRAAVRRAEELDLF
jgi:LuxR family transcriptional regulator, maltose regulon positive regulatory protein